MNVKELQARQGNVNIELDIVEKQGAREFEKFGKPGKVCNAIGKDANGDTIKITLWNEQADQVNQGDKIKMDNGYVGEWQGELQLSTGKFGKIEVIGKSASTSALPTEKEEPRGEIPAVDPSVEEESID